MNAGWFALLGAAVGAFLGGMATYLAGRRAARATDAATIATEESARRAEWGRRLERALSLAVADSERARIAGYALLRGLLRSSLSTDEDRRELLAVAEDLVDFDVRLEQLTPKADTGGRASDTERGSDREA